jgi:hypothetical protein
MKLASASAVALLAMLTSGCVGLQLGKVHDPADGAARAIGNSEGYFRVVVEPSITNRDSIVDCRNNAARWVERNVQSVVLVSIDGAVGTPAMTLGVDDAKKICDTGSQYLPRFALLRVSSSNAPTNLTVTAVKEEIGNIKVGQIVSDIGKTAAFAGGVIGAGPTSGLIAVALTAEQMKSNLPDTVRTTLQSGGRDTYKINHEFLRKNQSRTFEVVTDEQPQRPVGTVRVSTEYLPSIFSYMANPELSTNFATLTPSRILEFRLEIQNNKMISAHLSEHAPRVATELAEAKTEANKDRSWERYKNACTQISDYARNANLTRRDSVILRWAYLSSHPRFLIRGFLPHECFDEDNEKEVTMLQEMGFRKLPG